MLGFIFSFIYNYILVAFVCLIATLIVLKIIKFEYAGLVAFQVAALAPLGAISIIPYIGWILPPLIAFFIIKKYINYEFKGMLVVIVIWFVIFVPVYLGVSRIANTLVLKTLLPPDAYNELMMKAREIHQRRKR